jgi:hypothetical protein
VSEPDTTRELAERGQPFGTADDTLTVAALLRCARHRRVAGAVLALDRSRRGLPPVYLAELFQTELGRMLSLASEAGTTSTGERLSDLDAVPLPPPGFSLDTAVLLDCMGNVDVLHRTTARRLIEQGRRGVDHARRRAERGLPPKTFTASVNDVVPSLTECEKAEIRRTT